MHKKTEILNKYKSTIPAVNTRCNIMSKCAWNTAEPVHVSFEDIMREQREERRIQCNNEFIEVFRRDSNANITEYNTSIPVFNRRRIGQIGSVLSLNLHELEPQVARWHINELINELINQMEHSKIKKSEFKIVTGLGNHNKKKDKSLKTDIENYLNEKNIRFINDDNGNEGILKVYLYDKMMNNVIATAPRPIQGIISFYKNGNIKLY